MRQKTGDIAFFLFILFHAVLLNRCSSPKKQDTIRLVISTEELAPVSDMLFGHFLEKCNWDGEMGADIAWDKKSGNLRKEVLLLMDSLHMPIVRFPGGSDVDFYQWTELIDSIPGKEGTRPPYDGRNGNIISQNELGLDEFLKLSQQLDFEPLLVVNFGDAWLQKRSINDAAFCAASWVAYCNGSVDSKIPKKYMKWVRARMKNGHKKPYGVKYFQIGNELWMVDKEEFPQQKMPLKSSTIRRYYQIVDNYIEEMRSIDPSIKIILEGNIKGLVAPAKRILGNKFDLMAVHHYTPWAMKNVTTEDGLEVDSISAEELYYAMISVPYFDSISGQSVFNDPIFENVTQNNLKVGITEWNWNGWVDERVKELGHKDSKLAQGIGAASYLHAFIRSGNTIELANQSMLVGNAWGINTIRVEKETDKTMLFPTGIISGLYSRFHGTRLLKSTVLNNQFFHQKFNIGGLKALPKVAFLDIVVTKNDTQLFIHVINRSFDKELKFRPDFSTLAVKNEYQQIIYTGEVYSKTKPIHAKHELVKKNRDFSENLGLLSAPPHSVNIYILDLK